VAIDVDGTAATGMYVGFAELRRRLHRMRRHASATPGRLKLIELCGDKSVAGYEEVRDGGRGRNLSRRGSPDRRRK
jgi:hypothetical protein